jgi:hypothetical protein
MAREGIIIFSLVKENPAQKLLPKAKHGGIYHLVEEAGKITSSKLA